MARILVIEDNDGVRRLAGRALEHAGHEVFFASDSTGGLRLWRSQNVNLIVVDVGLPGKTGIETIVEMRTLQPCLPVVVISGQDRLELFEAIHAAGLNSGVQVLSKPFEIDALASAVRALLWQPAPEEYSSE